MVKFKYTEIANSENLRDRVLRTLVLNFIDSDSWKDDVDFAPENDEYELKLTVTGNYEINLNTEKLIEWMMEYGIELEQENRKLKDKLSNIRSKVCEFIDEEKDDSQ